MSRTYTHVQELLPSVLAMKEEGYTYRQIDQSVGAIFPNMDDVNNEYQIGFSVDKNLIPTLHIRDRKGTVNSVLLKIELIQHNGRFDMIGIPSKDFVRMLHPINTE